MNSNKKFEPQNNTGYLWHSQDESKVLRKGSITLDDGNCEEKKYVAIVKTTMGDKEKYELFVAAGQIFLNTEKRSEKSPDISGNIQIDPEFANLNRIDLSFTTTSESVIYIPIDCFQNLFKFNIRKNEIMNDDFDHIRFAIDRNNWNKNNYKIPFSQSYVYPSAALNVRSKISKQNVENDMLRSMVKDITGSLNFTMPTANDYIFFSKNNELNMSAVLVYYAQVKFVNDLLSNCINVGVSFTLEF